MQKQNLKSWSQAIRDPIRSQSMWTLTLISSIPMIWQKRNIAKSFIPTFRNLNFSNFSTNDKLLEAIKRKS